MVFFKVVDDRFFDGIYLLEGDFDRDIIDECELWSWFPCVTSKEILARKHNDLFAFPVELFRQTLEFIGEEVYDDNDQEVFKTRRRST